MNENRCVICGEIIPEGRQVCPKCGNTAKKTSYALRKDYFADRRNQRKLNGQCTTCGVPLPLGCKTVLCPACHEKARSYAEKYKQKRKAEKREKKARAFQNADMYNYEEANICLTCKAVKCTGNCIRFQMEKSKLEEG